MEQGLSSGFIYTKNVDDIEMLERCGTTSLAYKIRIGGRLFFIKKLRPELYQEKRYRYLFYKEFNTGKGIKSPFVVEYIDIKDNADGLHILMEYVGGSTLSEKIEKEPQYFQRKENCEKLLLQLCQALKALHKENIVHLDIKPENIIIQQTSNNLKLVDLGFCLSNYDESSPGSTAKYGAPETKLDNIKEIDARTDIYAVGCILQYIEEKSGKRLPGNLEHIKKRCLQPLKEKRYNSVEEIIPAINAKSTNKIMAIIIPMVTFCILAPFATQVYNTVHDYIEWERGNIADKFEEKGYHYLITDHDTRTVELTYKGTHPDEYTNEYNDGEVKIPATVTHRGRTFRVTSIGSQAFDNPETTSIIFPEGLESIKREAFLMCRLTGVVHIPSTIKEIGEWVFESNTQIEGFAVHENNPKFDSRNGCNAIIETATNRLVVACANTVIPENVTIIGRNAFIQQQMPSIVIPESVERIEEYAFHQSAIKEIVIPRNVKKIEGHTFLLCQSLQKVILPQGLAEIAQRAFCNSGLQEIVIPDSVTDIEEKAFAGCKSLQTAIIGCRVKNLGAYAFEECDKLTKVVSRIPADKLTATGSGCFSGINKNCILYVPRGAKSTYKNTYGWNLFTKIVEVDI